MYKLLLFLFISGTLHAQKSDILLLQKHNKTIGHFFHGSYMQFYTTEGMLVTGNVDRIERDSLFLLYYDIKMRPNIFGTYSPDTLAVYTQQYSIANIAAFPIRNKKFNLITNGSLFMLGGGAYLVLNFVNTLRENDPYFGKDNLPHVIGALSVLGLGIVLNLTQKTQYKLGKKYKLKILPGSNNDPIKTTGLFLMKEAKQQITPWLPNLQA